MRISIPLWRMRWVFPRGDNGGRNIHGGGQGFGVVVGGDGGQHAGEFGGAGQIVFHFQINIAFRGHGIASFQA